MNGNKFNYALVFAVILQFIGLVWYLSKVDSKVNILYGKFEKDSETSVVENQVKMKLDIENLLTDVNELKQELKKSLKKDKKIMKQHEQIFELLQGNTNTGDISYGD
tara:strand:- start:3799 stop:4119 length:321 start_codon:yes stop_codon:yes gene_type:complete